MQIFVLHGSTCYSGTQFVCLAESKRWQTTLIAAGRKAYHSREESTMQFRKVYDSIDESCALHAPRLKNFVTMETGSDDLPTRCVVVAIFTPLYTHFGACHWPKTTSQWELFDGNTGLYIITTSVSTDKASS